MHIFQFSKLDHSEPHGRRLNLKVFKVFAVDRRQILVLKSKTQMAAPYTSNIKIMQSSSDRVH